MENEIEERKIIKNQTQFMHSKQIPWAIVFSCIDKPRSFREISMEWGVKKKNDPTFYRGGLLKKLWDYKLIKVSPTKFEGGKEYYWEGNIDWGFDYLELFKKDRSYLENQLLLSVVFNNKDSFKKFLNKNKKVIWELRKLKILFNNDIESLKKNHEYLILATFYIPLFLSIKKSLSKTKDSKGKLPTEEQLFALISSTLKVVSMGAIELNLHDYTMEVLKEINPNDIDTKLTTEMAKMILPEKIFGYLLKSLI